MLLDIAMFITITVYTLSRKLTCHVGKLWSIDTWINRSSESTYLKFSTKSGPGKVRGTTVKNPWNGREKPVKSHQKLAAIFYSFFGVFCNLFTGSSLKSLEPLAISSSLGTYRLEIGWWAAVAAEAVECMWGLVGFPLYMSTYPKIPKINITIV